MSPPTPPSSSSISPPPPPHQTPHFTPIPESEREGTEPNSEVRENKNQETPNIPHPKKTKPIKSKRTETDENAPNDGTSISCNKCRPHAREKFSVVPLDNSHNKQSLTSPNGIFKNILTSLTKKSPKLSSSMEVSSSAREEQWKIALAELSHKLIHATRKRDEAIMEASRLKRSMEELEKKLNKVEVYCHKLKSGLDECSSNSPRKLATRSNRELGFNNSDFPDDKLIQSFLLAVSESRSNMRILSRSLVNQFRHIGSKVFDKISVLLQPFDIKISKNPSSRSLLHYLEALLNRAFFEDFESAAFQKNAANSILNPIERCELNFEAYGALKSLTWEEVLHKGTRHFSEDFSRFCDRKMSEIVAMLGWNRAWPEPLLQAFFGAAKSVWLVHLLANSVHPSLPIFRVDNTVHFDSVYLEDMSADKARKLVPTTVRMMVAPGFYVYGNVVKSKVLCRYNSSNYHHNNIDENVVGLTPSP